MSYGRFDAFDGYGRYDDMAFPYPELEQDFPIDFAGAISEGRRRRDEESRAAMKARGLYVAEKEDEEDFWDLDPHFISVTSKEDFKKLENLMIEADAAADARDQELLKWERAPLRHIKKKGRKNGYGW
jgi:hypothetical protein